MYRLPKTGDETMTDFGPVPKLSLKQKLLLAIGAPVFVRYVKPEGYRAYVPVYVARCQKHGLFVDKENGFERYLLCPKCFDERKETRKRKEQIEVELNQECPVLHI